MKKIQITELSYEELQKRFDYLEHQLDDIQKNFQPKQPPKYVTRQYVAEEIIHCDVSTVHNLTVRGVLIKHQIGGRVLYRLDQVLEEIVQLNK